MKIYIYIYIYSPLWIEFDIPTISSINVIRRREPGGSTGHKQASSLIFDIPCFHCNHLVFCLLRKLLQVFSIVKLTWALVRTFLPVQLLLSSLWWFLVCSALTLSTVKKIVPRRPTQVVKIAVTLRRTVTGVRIIRNAVIRGKNRSTVAALICTIDSAPSQANC